MRAAWRLATSGLSARRTRTGLLVCCVALCATLVSAIACAIASINAGLDARLTQTVGAADARVVTPGKGVFDGGVVDKVRGWPEVRVAAPRLVESLAVKNVRTGSDGRVLVYGIDPAGEGVLRPQRLVSGRGIQSDDEALLDTRSAEELGLKLGDMLTVVRFGDGAELKVVGILAPPPLSGFLGPTTPAYFTLSALQRIADRPGRVNEIELMLRDPDPRATEAFAAKRGAELERPLAVQPTARATAGFQANRASSQIGLIVASVFAFLASSFIIATGMTTGVSERTRELAVLRCIGAAKGQLAGAQVFAGGIVGLLGSLVGVPIGVVGSWVLVTMYPEQLPGGFVVSGAGVVMAAAGSVFAGVVGSLWSAWSAARVSPLEGLATRARPVRGRTILLMLAAGVGLIGVHALIVWLRPGESDRFFWVYAPVAIPAMLTGYFLVGTPLTAGVVRAMAPVLSLVLGLPPRLLGRTLKQTPYRHGFTAASMMIGVAMLVSIWTNGKSVMEFWLERLAFPDAFVYGVTLRPDTAERIRGVPGVQDACATTMHTVGTDAFGVKGLTRYKTTFFAFEPEPFFRMNRIEWVQGTQEGALERLKQGGAVLVANEFFTTRGIGVGKTVRLFDQEERPHDFEVVGVVTSPGLDVASKFFDVGEGYLDQAVNSVFGSRADMIAKFGNDSINFIPMNFTPGSDPQRVYEAVRSLPRTGILAGGTAVWLKQHLREMIGGTLRVFSLVAVGALVIASFGVANIIIAGVQARTYQFGVLRAVGAQRWMLGRLVIGEAVVIAVAASILGSLLGLQAAWGGQMVTTTSIGIDFGLSPPWAQIGWSWLAVAAVTLGASLPTALALVRKPPRVLLGVVRG